MLKLLALCGFAFSFSASAVGVSAHRAPGADFREYLETSRIAQQNPGDDSSSKSPAAADVAVPLDQLNIQSLPQWDTFETVQAGFERLRDTRFLEDPSHPGFLRRDSWLYPDDGCYARAALAKKNLHNWKFAAVKKVFVFGNLRVDTANSPAGFVTWWYHVVNGLMLSGQPYVLDPAIDPLTPLTLNEWAQRMGGAKAEMTFAICDDGAYTPYDACVNPPAGSDNTALDDQVGFFDSEWDRLTELKRDANLELGEQPPWPLHYKNSLVSEPNSDMSEITTGIE